MTAEATADRGPRAMDRRRSTGVRGVWSLVRAALPDVAIVALLALLPRLYFWRLFASNPVDQRTIVEGDFSHEYFPVLVTAARSLREGAWPLWNPFSNAGQPLLADPQSALLYPPTWLALWGIQGFDGDSFQALQRLIPLHFALAGVFTYALARVLIGSRWGALVAALVFCYSGFLTSYPVQQLPILRAVVWFPLQVLGLWLALERRSLRWAVLAGAALGLAVLAGHPQTAFLEVVGLSIVALVWGYQQWAGGAPWSRTLRAFSMLSVVGVVGLGLSAGQWLPSYEFTRLSSRVQVGYEFLSGGFMLWEAPMNLLAPRVLGGLPPYVGVLPLLLAAVALALRRARVHGVAAALVLVGLVLALGGHTFVYPALYLSVPGFDLFRNQERAILLFSLGMALLAGSGVATLQARLAGGQFRRLRRVVGWGGLGLAAALAVGGALYFQHLQAEVSGEGVHRWREIVHWYFLFVLLLACSVGLLALRTHLRAARAALPALMAGLIVLDLFTVSWEVNLQDRRPDEVFRASGIVERLLDGIGTARAVNDGVLNGNHGLVYGIPTITQSFALHLDRFERAGRELPTYRLYDLLNVGYVVTRQTEPDLGQVVLEEPFRDATNLLYKRDAELRPAYVVGEAIGVASGEEALAVVADEGFDIHTRVALEGMDESLPRGGPGRVLWLERGWDDIRLEVSAPDGGYLVLSEIAYPGWRAEVNGEEQPILQANYLLRAVWLEPGDHRVRFSYQPASVQLGVGASLATLAALGLWLAVSGFRRLGAQRNASTP